MLIDLFEAPSSYFDPKSSVEPFQKLQTKVHSQKHQMPSANSFLPNLLIKEDFNKNNENLYKIHESKSHLIQQINSNQMKKKRGNRTLSLTKVFLMIAVIESDRATVCIRTFEKRGKR